MIARILSLCLLACLLAHSAIACLQTEYRQQEQALLELGERLSENALKVDTLEAQRKSQRGKVVCCSLGCRLALPLLTGSRGALAMAR